MKVTRSQLRQIIKESLLVETEMLKIMDNPYEDLSAYNKRLKKSAAMIIFGTYDDRFRIPLCFSGFGITSKHIISDQVRSIDIFPTILELCGIKIKQKKIGTSFHNFLNFIFSIILI